MSKPSEHGVRRPGAQHRQPLRSTNGAFDDDETAAFLLGVTIPVRSSNMKAAWYDDEEGRLYAQFRNDSVYSIEADEHLLESFARASSKGGWWHDHVTRTGKEALRVL